MDFSRYTDAQLRDELAESDRRICRATELHQIDAEETRQKALAAEFERRGLEIDARA